MCFSATVSFGTAALLLGTGIYAVRKAGNLPRAYLAWALIPVLFAIQQAFEGGVWLALAAQNPDAAISMALGFHFFSHFLWLWWIPLCSYLVEPEQILKLRKRIFAGCAVFGAFSGTLVYSVMLLHPEWMTIAVKEYSIVYDFSVPYRSDIQIPVTPVMLYGLTILIPLLFSSLRPIKIFGILLMLSMALASATFNAAFVSVWCFFAALLSLYVVYMLRRLAAIDANSTQ